LAARAQSFPRSSTAPVLTGRFGRKTAPDDRGRDEVLARAITAAKAGDSDAMRYLYVRYADNVYGYARGILRNEHDAEDVTQQVFVKLLTAIGKYEPREVPFSGWILRVTHNVAIDHLRRQRAVPCGEVVMAEEPRDDAGNQRTQRLLEAFASLPEDQREVLVMRHILGMSPPEIAKQLGKSEGSIHGLHHRGRRPLQQALSDFGLAPATAN
jgi:RNA polymerase sigma-70 factor, ECF subfamily